MNRLLPNRAAPTCIILLCAIASFIRADEITSVMISSTTGPLSFRVTEDQFLRIDNFTQENGSERGAVMVTKGGQTANALNATIIDAGPPPSVSPAPEFIKSIRIDGPAKITVNPVTDATLFITYKKYTIPPKATPTPTPTATPIPTATATPIPTATATPTPTPTPAATP